MRLLPLLPAIAAIGATLLPALHAAPVLRITEVMSSSGTGGTEDWFEITNVGDAPADLTGYKIDDNSFSAAGAVALVGVGMLEAGESAVFTEVDDDAGIAAFRTFWAADELAGIKVGRYGGSGVGLSSGGDGVAVYTPGNAEVARVSFTAATKGSSFYYVYNSSGTLLSTGSPISSAGSLGAFVSASAVADVASPGSAASSLDLSFSSGLKKFATTGQLYSSPVSFLKKSGSDVATLSIVSGPPWLSLTNVTQSGGTLTGIPATTQTGPLSVTLRLSVPGQPQVELTAPITVFSAQPRIVLNEFNAVGGSDLHTSLDGDLRLGRIEGNGGDWFELVVTGAGFGTTLDMRGWRIDVSQISDGTRLTDTVTLSTDVFWAAVPAGTILTFTEDNAEEGGYDTALDAENNLATSRYAWSNIWLGDTRLVASVAGDSEAGIVVSKDDTQVSVRNSTGGYEFGPAGEGTWRFPEIDSKSCFYLAADPASGIDPSRVRSDPRFSALYFGKEPVTPSTFGLPNISADGIQPLFGVRPPYFASRPHRLSREGELTFAGVDYRQNDNHSLTFALRMKGGGAAPAWITVSASGFFADIDLEPSSGDAGIYELEMVLTDNVTNAQTTEPYALIVLPATSEVILNEYNAVSGSKFLNDGVIDPETGDGTDTFFGTVAGNGGDWFELVVVGNGSASTVDMRGWKIEIDDAAGNVFQPDDTLVLSQDSYWAAVPAGTVLTFTENTTADGGSDTWINRTNRLGRPGGSDPGDGAYAWSNIHLADGVYIDQAASSYGDGIAISSTRTQFRILKSNNAVVNGPVGEGIWPLGGISNVDVMELEADPTPDVSPYVEPGTTFVDFGYDDGKGSTFGSPNLHEGGTVAQDFSPYIRTNSAPVFSNSPLRGLGEGEAYSFSAETTDAENQVVTVSVVTKPAWLTLSAGVLSGTAPSGSAGTVLVELRATDSAGGFTSLKFNLTVTSMGGFGPWSMGASRDSDADGNGFPALLEYAFGAAAPGGTFEKPTHGFATIANIDYLILTAVVRTDDPAITVRAQSSTTLGPAPSPWSDADVQSAVSANQAAVPAGAERRVFRTPRNGAGRKFLRIEVR